MIEEREPVAKENENTPMSMRKMQKSFSSVLYARMSP